MPAEASIVPEEQVKELSEMGDMHEMHMSNSHADEAHHHTYESEENNLSKSNPKLKLNSELIKELLLSKLSTKLQQSGESNEDSSSMNSDEYEQFLGELEKDYLRKNKLHGPRRHY